MTDRTCHQIEPYPTDGEERDHETAEREMDLQHRSVFRIDDAVFEYRGIVCGEAVVTRLSGPHLRSNNTERFPVTELWDAYQRGKLELGKWRCRFVAIDEPTADDE
jgi:hypothetical protein